MLIASCIRLGCKLWHWLHLPSLHCHWPAENHSLSAYLNSTLYAERQARRMCIKATLRWRPFVHPKKISEPPAVKCRWQSWKTPFRRVLAPMTLSWMPAWVPKWDRRWKVVGSWKARQSMGNAREKLPLRSHLPAIKRTCLARKGDMRKLRMWRSMIKHQNL